MNRNKYYTPNISEFCLGFEFEYFMRNQTEEGLDPKWVKSKVILDGSPEAQIKGLTFPMLEGIPIKYYQIGLALKNKTIRVKHLDEQDIRDLGFDTEVNSEGDIEFSAHGSLMGELLKRQTKYTVHAISAYFNVKNKTEFEKLLKYMTIIK